MSEPTREPEWIKNLDRRVVPFVRGENGHGEPIVDVSAMADAYDAIVAERDAAVRERDVLRERANQFEVGMVEAAQRLAVCERDLNYIRRVTVGAVESDKLAATCKTIGEYRYVLLKAINAMDIAAVAAETQGVKDA